LPSIAAAIASTVGAVLSFIGLIHAPEVAWAANPPVALGYLFFGIVCVGYGFLPGAKDPVEVDEADIVAGHLSEAGPLKLR
jgi:AGZA family xanthine/uracil permease-like MFS transporter